MIKIGPAGDISHETTWDDGGREQIVQIFVSHGEQINSLQFLYVDDGNLLLSDKHGTSSGPKFNVVKLNYPSEYLTGMSGSYCVNNDNQWLILSITFNTNNRAYGPFGDPDRRGYTFDYQLGEDNAFGGFHGRAGNYLNAIGVYVKPITTLSVAKDPSKFPADVAPVATVSSGGAPTAATAAKEEEKKKKSNDYFDLFSDLLSDYNGEV